MGVWSVLVNCLFPVPLLALLLLCLPLPAKIAAPVRHAVNKALDVVLFTKIFGSFSLYQISTILSIFLFAESTYSTIHATARSEQSEIFHDKMRGLKWRAERNFWIALFSLTLWIILFRVHRMSKELETSKANGKAD
jgi:hypothetical protein